jgi:hypothetical protein
LEHACGDPVAHVTLAPPCTTQSSSHVTWHPPVQCTVQPGPAQCCMQPPVQPSEQPAPVHVWLQSPVHICLHPGAEQTWVQPAVQVWVHDAAVHVSGQPLVHCWEQATSPLHMHGVLPTVSQV